MKIGYARTSTLDQAAGIAAQIRDLEAAGCERVFSEQVSSVQERAELEAALEFARAGDVFTVTKLDRLARSVTHLGQINERLRRRGVFLHVLNLGMDTSSATGELIYNVLASIAQFERAMMLERQREGIAKAKAEGKYTGRKPTAAAKADEVRKLDAEGIDRAEIARRVKIGRSSVYRILGARSPTLAV